MSVAETLLQSGFYGTETTAAAELSFYRRTLALRVYIILLNRNEVLWFGSAGPTGSWPGSSLTPCFISY